MAGGGIVKIECLTPERSCSFVLNVSAETEEPRCNISGAFGISDKALTEQAIAEMANIFESTIERLKKRNDG